MKLETKRSLCFLFLSSLKCTTRVSGDYHNKNCPLRLKCSVKAEMSSNKTVITYENTNKLLTKDITYTIIKIWGVERYA